jgi:hypothetical protein
MFLYRPEHSKAMSGSNHPNFGITMSDRTKQKISETKRRRFLEKKQLAENVND